MVTDIIFDLGGVLIDWNPDYVFDQVFDDKKQKEHFFEHICTPEWNEEQDAGRTIKDATDLLIVQHPEWKEHIEAYYGRWEEMLGGPIQGTVTILKELIDSGKYRIYALTNWSAELFPIALQRYEFLHWFHGRLVSGEEKTRKPFREIYEMILDRFSINPANAIFIDDNLRNVKAAEESGIPSIRFENPDQLRTALHDLGVL